MRCEHIHWQVYGCNSAKPMCGTCNDCKKEVGLDELLSGTAIRHQKLIEKVEQLLKKMEIKNESKGGNS